MTEHNAVTFDQPTFRAWLTATSQDSDYSNKEAVEVLATGYQQDSGDAGWLIEGALFAVRDAKLGDASIWSYGPGVGAVRVWPVADPEAGQDGIFGEVIADGVVLSLGHVTDRDLVRVEAPMMAGYEAAEVALAGLADRVNKVVGQFRDTVRQLVAAATDAEIVDAEIVDAEIVD